MDKKEIQKLTHDELQTKLIANGVYFKENASKEELIKLLEENSEKIDFSKEAINLDDNKKKEKVEASKKDLTDKENTKAKQKDEVKKVEEESLGLAVIENSTDQEETGISLRENTMEEKTVKPKASKTEEKEEEFELDGLANAGTILNIIGAALWLPFTIMASLVIIGIPFLIGDIFTITSNLAYRRGKGNRTKAGVLGILFGFIIGGIFVLIAEDQSAKKEK